jgi:hypothetical protein
MTGTPLIFPPDDPRSVAAWLRHLAGPSWSRRRNDAWRAKLGDARVREIMRAAARARWARR